MINVFTVPEADIVALYVQSIRNILVGAHVRHILFQGQHLVNARIWNGTHGFTTTTQKMDRAVLDTFRVESSISAVVGGVMEWHTFYDLIDSGVSHDIDDPLCGHDLSDWGDVGVAAIYKCTLRDMVIKRMREIRSQNERTIREMLLASPEAIAVGEEAHARCLAEAPAIRKHFVNDTFTSMGKALQTLVDENVATEDILSAVARMVETLRSIPKPAEAGTGGDLLMQWGAHAKAQTDKKRVDLMESICKAVAEGTFQPKEWLWCFKGQVGVGQKADGDYAQIAFTQEDIAFIRENCAPTEVDWNTLSSACTGRR